MCADRLKRTLNSPRLNEIERLVLVGFSSTIVYVEDNKSGEESQLSVHWVHYVYFDRRHHYCTVQLKVQRLDR